jgi:hypothetical protein
MSAGEAGTLEASLVGGDERSLGRKRTRMQGPSQGAFADDCIQRNTG